MKNTPENIELIKKFLVYVVKELGIKTNATIKFLSDHDPEVPSAGGYLPGERVVMVAVNNRALADILRSLAHEMTHKKQDEEGRIGPNDTDNQKLEDEANIWSGRLVRWFGRENKEIYADLSKDYKS